MYKGTTRVFVGDGANVSNSITHLSGISKGDLFLIRENGTILTSVVTTIPKFEKVTVACGIADGVAILSSPIQGNTVSKYEGKAYVAPTEMVTYLGYDGATVGSTFVKTTDLAYRLRILDKDTNRINGQRSTLLGECNYTATSTDTAFSVLTQIAKQYYAKAAINGAAEAKIKVERVSNGTFVASDNILTVVKGSKTAVFTTAATYGSTAFAVGDFIRIGGTGATVSVYQIAALDTLTITLDLPYQGASAAVAAASVGHLTTPTEVGLKLTGVAISSKLQRNANEPVDQYEWMVYDASLAEVYNNASGANPYSANPYKATVTVSQKALPGSGYWKQVADAEEMAKGNWGDSSKRRFFDQRIDSNVVAGTTYSSIVITHSDVHGGNFQGTESSPVRTEIYIPYNTVQGDATTANFRLIMNGFFSDSLGFTAIDAL